MKEANDLKLEELRVAEAQEINGGVHWLVLAAAGTFLYNVAGDWHENVAAFKAGMEAAK